MTGTTIETFSGRALDFMDPRADDIDLHDIAHALAFTCRFGGHVHTFESVAEHAVLVSKIVGEQSEDPLLAFAALHHDDHEAYVGDIPTPLKNALGGAVSVIAHGLDKAIARYLGIDVELFHHPLIRDADEQALYIEARALRAHMSIELWGAGPDITTDLRLQWAPVGYGSTLYLDQHVQLAEMLNLNWWQTETAA